MAAPALDPSVFNEMRELMADAMSEFIQTYINNTHGLISKIETGIAQQDAKAIYHAAHQIKGGSGSIGARQLVAIALEIEIIGRAGATEGVSVLLLKFQAEFARVVAELTEHL